MTVEVTENVRLCRFELPIAESVIATAYYRVEDERIVLVHTEVPFEFSGQGIATRLALGTFELLRNSGRKAIPQCPFMSRFVVKHREYFDVVAG